jgi:SsrA-binding protein
MKAFITHRRARFDFELLDTYEAGIELLGSEVKAIRAGKGKLEGAHVIVRGREAYLVGASIPAHQAANAPASYEPERVRRLLLGQKEIDVLSQKSDQKGLTMVPISMYSRGRNIKLQIAVARGKKKQDKRELMKERDTKRDIERTLKGKNT